MMKKVFAAIFLITVFVSTGCLGGTERKKDTQATEKPQKLYGAAKIGADIQNFIEDKKEVYLYFYSKTYKKSSSEIGRIRTIAKKEKAGFISIDIDASNHSVLMNNYGVAFVPSVIHIRRGLGIVENFPGPKAVKGMKKGRKTFTTNKHMKRIAENGKRGAATLLEFYADWCSPCLKQMPILDSASKMAGGKLDIIRLHMDVEKDMSALYNVDAPPANIVLDENGVPRYRIVSISYPELLLGLLADLGLL